MCGRERCTYLQDRSLSVVPPLCSPSGAGSSSEDVTSITLPRFARGDARLAVSLPLRGGTGLLSSRALDRRSPSARLRCRRAATSTSHAASSASDALRFPLPSLGRTILKECRQHKSVETDTNTDTSDVGSVIAKAALPIAEDLWVTGDPMATQDLKPAHDTCPPGSNAAIAVQLRQRRTKKKNSAATQN